MRSIKLGIITLAILAMTGAVYAGGVGYIDYAKVIDSYDYAKQVTKEVDAKGLEIHFREGLEDTRRGHAHERGTHDSQGYSESAGEGLGLKT